MSEMAIAPECPECGASLAYDDDTDTYDCMECGGCFDESELLGD